MSKNIFIDSGYAEETRIIVSKDNKVIDIGFETETNQSARGNIYLAIVKRLEPSLEAVFVDYGGERNGFLRFSDIHPDYHVASKATPSVDTVIKLNQVLLVQIVREPIDNKGALLTTYLSFTGIHTSFIPNRPRGRALTVGDLRLDYRKTNSIRKSIDALGLPLSASLLVRRTTPLPSTEDIAADYQILKQKWLKCRDHALEYKAPALTYSEDPLIDRTIRDHFNSKITKIIVEGHNAFEDVCGYLKQYNIDTSVVEHHTDTASIFDKYQLEKHFASLYDPIANLPSGGYLIIEQTAAFVSIDVNSGRATRTSSVENTALTNNLEAAIEIAQQIRLRDMAGIIVIDFIDMVSAKNRRAVESELSNAFQTDERAHEISTIGEFGVLEMTRQRKQGSVLANTTSACGNCNGIGRTRTLRSRVTFLLRQIRRKSANFRGKNVMIHCQPDIIDYLDSETDGTYIEQIQKSSGKKITLVSDIYAKTTQIELLTAAQSKTRLAKSPAPRPAPLDAPAPAITPTQAETPKSSSLLNKIFGR